MRAVYPPLHHATHPQRQPFVRSTTFIDGKGPPPFDFYDQFQDHLGAFIGAQSGYSCSADMDEFEGLGFRSGYFGKLGVVLSSGVLVQAGVATGSAAGDIGVYGVASVTGNTPPWHFAACGGIYGLSDDFLVSAKVKILAPENLDTADVGGFVLGIGSAGTRPLCPGFAAGGDSPNWRLLWAPDGVSAYQLYDTGIPITAGVWYRLQVSRVMGAVRWFINGQLCRFRLPQPPIISVAGTASGTTLSLRLPTSIVTIPITAGWTAETSASAIKAAINAAPVTPLTASVNAAVVSTIWISPPGPTSLSGTDTSQVYTVTYPNPPTDEGLHYPFTLTEAQKWLSISRWRNGPTAEGFLIDFFHLFARRSTP